MQYAAGFGKSSIIGWSALQLKDLRRPDNNGKMQFALLSNSLQGFTEKEFKDAPKNQIYENLNRINAITKYVADLLVKDVYRKIRGTGKAMLAVYSIKSAIAYKAAVTEYFNELVKQPKYRQYAAAPIHVVYSSNQDEPTITEIKLLVA